MNGQDNLCQQAAISAATITGAQRWGVDENVPKLPSSVYHSKCFGDTRARTTRGGPGATPGKHNEFRVVAGAQVEKYCLGSILRS